MAKRRCTHTLANIVHPHLKEEAPMRDTDVSLSHFPWHGPGALTDAPCIRDSRRELSYAQVHLESVAFAGQLADQGINEGDVIAVMLPNSTELLVAILGAWLRGAAVTPINPTLTPREAEYQLRDSHAGPLVGEGVEGSSLTVIGRDGMQRAPRDGAEDVTLAADKDRIALIVYTSGSTGQPKGVVLDHANLDAMSTQIACHFRLSADDHALLVLPLFHVNSLSVSFLAPVSVGAQVTILERFSPAPFAESLARHQPTYFSGVPPVFAPLLALPSEITLRHDRLRFAVCGAAPISPELLARCESRFDFAIIEGYGLTEATCASACNPIAGSRKPGSVGPALVGQEIRIVDHRGHDVAPGERGEILISGPTVMRGYLGRPDATAETIADGWLHTGDVGTLDEDGYLRVVDRIKDMLIRGGENIYPKEIESFLATHPAVLEAAVVGRADEVLGEVPVAWVVTDALPGGITPEELTHFCRQ